MNGQQRTIVRLWRDAVASGRPDPLYLAESDGDWTPVPLAEAARRVDELANGLLALGIRKGDSFGILAGHAGRVVPLRLRARARRRRDGAGLRELVARGLPLRPRPLRRRRRARRGRGAAREDRSRARRAPALEHVLTFAELRRARGARQGLRGRAAHARSPTPRAGSARTTSSRSSSRRARPARPRPARSSTATTTRWPRSCTTWPTSSSEDDLLLLYLPLAHNFGRLTHLLAPMAGYTIAFCADPYAVADALLKVKPTVFPSVPRVYEKIHTAVVATFDEATGIRRRLIDWALDVGRRVSVLRQQGRPDPAWPRGPAPSRRPPRVLEGEGRASAAACGAPSPAARRSPSRSSSSSTRSTSSSSRRYGLTECTTGRHVEPRGQLQVRHRRQGAAGLGAEARRGRRALHPQPDRLRGLLQGRGGDGGHPRRRRLARDRGHRHDRRRRLRDDHRPQEGHPRHGRAARTSPRRTSRTS